MKPDISPSSSPDPVKAKADKSSEHSPKPDESSDSHRNTININVSVSVDPARHRSDLASGPERDDRHPYGVQQYSKSPVPSTERTSASPPLSAPKHYYQQPPEQLVMNAYSSHDYQYAPYYQSRYAQSYPPSHQYVPPYGAPTYAVPGSPMNELRSAYNPPQSYQPASNGHVVHTDDAATKLTDRVRRKCYNCRTTDTSTWRRSNLTPGKVLCNKCGLFERTHLRPRPEQFPHKRGPMSSAISKSRNSPPTKMSPPVQNVHGVNYHSPLSTPPLDHYDGASRQMQQREYIQNTLPGTPSYTTGSGSHHSCPLSPPMRPPMARDAMSAGQAVDRSPELTLPSLSRSSSPPHHHIQHAMAYSNNRERM